MKDKEKQIVIKRGELADLLNQELAELQKVMQIEEMVKEIFNTCAWRFSNPNDYKEVFNDIAEDLTKLNYRKLPEDSVVLSKEEYDKFYESVEATILSNIADGGTSCHWCSEKYQKIGYEKGSKETAEKILKEFYKRAEKFEKFDDCFEYYEIREDDFEEVVKQFGVEVDK